MSPALRVLVVDDEAAQRTILTDILRAEGHEVESAESGREGAARLRAGEWDLVVTDLRMPDGDGLELLREGRRLHEDLTIILMTAYGTVSSAVEAMKSGAYDFLQKPFGKEELIQRVRRVAERTALRRENRRLREELAAKAPPMLGDSPPMRKLRQQMERLASAEGNVLILGESGTGKELAARALHFQGPRAEGPFVAVNCAAIPEGLAESELFGHEKGAFTHAAASRAGRFEQADGGTLFFDEISSMPLPLQAKLLRVLQERTVERVGSNRPRAVDVRILAAANRGLDDLLRDGQFRADLYHRLCVHELHLPPLRDREGDILLLADHFRDRAAARHRVPPPLLTQELLAFLSTYSFPGNVRELMHLMETMVLLSEGEPLGIEDLPLSARRAAASGTFSGSMNFPDERTGASSGAPSGAPSPEDLLRAGPIRFFEVEARLIEEAIRRSGGNLSEAARLLGLSYKTLRYRARKFGLAGDEAEGQGTPGS